ncbi:ubiquitin-conjugating enzyme E2 variant 3 [Gracilaria domingensis]|nr:ubiquitin-conjugating enzyme E2 variant 3 [Gracilaria domingensis]
MRLVILVGVIPVKFRQVTYQIPVAIWCGPHYPDDEPIPYVRPTPEMVLRTRHSHLDTEGRVYLPHYRAQWDPTQHNLYGVVVAMIRVFSIEPPVHKRPTIPAPASNEPERRRLISTLTTRLSERFNDASEEAVTDICQLLKQKDDMVRSGQSVTKEMRLRALQLEKTRREMQQTEADKQALLEWQSTINRHDEQDGQNHQLHVDDILEYSDMLDEQICTCIAKDGAFSDALDQLDEAFVKGVIDQDAYMKYVRDISREQFFPRALKKKIELEKSKRVQVDEHGVTRRMRSGPVTPLFAS